MNDEQAFPRTSFLDTKGRAWPLAFNVALARRIRTVAGVDFVNHHDGKAMQAINASDEKLVQVLWLLCEDECNRRSVNEEDFGSALGGDALGAAIDAIMEAVVLFCRPDKRPAMAAIVNRGKQATKRATELAVAKINSEAATKAIERRVAKAGREIDEALNAETFGDTSTTAPRS